MKFLKRSVSSSDFDVQAARLGIWAASILVLVFGVLTLAKLELSQAELFFGLLLVLAVSEILVLIGLVLPMVATHDRARN